MRRTILTSFLVIGAALAVLFGGGTFSAFNDVENISGTATAAILDFELSGDGTTTGTQESDNDETLAISFENTGAPPCLFAYFAPGDSCTIQVTLTRPNVAQQLAANLAVTNFTVTATPSPAGGDLDATDPVIAYDCDSGGSSPHAGAEWTVSYAFVDPVGSATHMPAGLPDTDQRIDVTVALHADAGNGCQNSALTAINIEITATQDASPHNPTD